MVESEMQLEAATVLRVPHSCPRGQLYKGARSRCLCSV